MPTQLNLILQYCNSVNPERQKEYDFCLLQNLHNPHIAKIFNLKERLTVVPDVIRNHPKYAEHPVSHWLTYETAFKFANEVIGSDAFCCLCNLDIFLDINTDWAKALDFIEKANKVVFCLSRHEFDGTNKATLDQSFVPFALANTQDAWLFKTPLEVKNCNFELGLLGCDNAIADRINKSGYIPFNSPLEYKIFHYDLCRKVAGPQERYQSQTSRVRNKYPEREGQLLLPAYGYFQSVDQLLDAVKATPLQKYAIICEIFSNFFMVKNP